MSAMASDELEHKEFTISFYKQGKFTKCIKKLRDKIRENGTAFHAKVLNLTYKGKSIKLYMNLAYDAGHVNTPNASLYIMGFINHKGDTYRFDDKAFKPIGGTVLKGIDGSYGSLGYDDKLPKIYLAPADCIQGAIKALGNYNGGKYDDITTHLTKLIILTSEAVRFAKVTDGIQNMLDKYTSYEPDSKQIHSWDGRGLDA